MAEYYTQQMQAMRNAGFTNVQNVGVMDLVITFDAIEDTNQNRELYAQKLGGYVNKYGAIEINLQNGKLFVYLNDEDEENCGTAYASYN